LKNPREMWEEGFLIKGVRGAQVKGGEIQEGGANTVGDRLFVNKRKRLG